MARPAGNGLSRWTSNARCWKKRPSASARNCWRVLTAWQASSEPTRAQRLFAEDTVRGLRLLEVLSQAFDVVVMNPPYGALRLPESERIQSNQTYPRTNPDIYAAFIERATQLIEPEGYVGALVSSTFKTHVTHTKSHRVPAQAEPAGHHVGLGIRHS